jgi:hypothetical protein
MSTKRPASAQSDQHYSCESCYKRKLKCSRGSPCSHCERLKVECVQASTKRRKQRFPEAELLARIKRYERVLLSYGADLAAIRDDDFGQEEVEMSRSGKDTTSSEAPGGPFSQQHSKQIISQSEEHGEMSNLIDILEGEGTENKSDRVEKVFYSRFFRDDGASLFSAVEASEVPLHPAAFDIFKLWQTYSDNIHPICKILHAPTFQRKISSYGSQLHLAPASDQALFFGMYLAAILSLSPEVCQSSFGVSKEVLQGQYQHSALVWLQRAGFWRTSELSVLQAFVLYLFTQQHVMDPRALASFTGIADRLARRMGLHRWSHSKERGSLVEQEIRKRVWWELLYIDSRTLERAGMGNLELKGGWSTSLLDPRSDGDLDSQVDFQPRPPLQPASEMLFALARSRAARCQDDLANLFHYSHRERGSKAALLGKKLDLINSVQQEIEGEYLVHCNDSLPQHRLAVMFTRMTFSRMRFIVYSLEEASRKESDLADVRQHMLMECASNLEDFTTLRCDPEMQRFVWFLYQYMPAYVYIHTLRLLQKEVTGQHVERAWQVLEQFEASRGTALPVEKLILRAWNERQAFNFDQGIALQMPDFVNRIMTAEEDKRLVEHLPDGGAVIETPSDVDYMNMLAEVMQGNTEYNFDWSTWLHQSIP